VSAPAGPLIIGTCPVCAGQGKVPGAAFERTGEFFECLACGSTGDLDAHRLLLAYELGRQEVLRWFTSSAQAAAKPDLSVEDIKRRVDVQPDAGRTS
jgi:hypothetical protein